MTRYGDHPFALVDGSWMVSAGGAADVALARGERRPGDGRSRWSSFSERADLAVFRGIRRTGSVAPWLVLPLVFVLFRWLGADGFNPRVLGLAVFCGTLGYHWVGLVRPRLRLTTTGVWFCGGMRDELLAWSDVQAVVADHRGLVIRLADGAAALIDVPRSHLTWLLPGVDDPVVAAARCEEARLRSGVVPVSAPPASVPAGRHERRHGTRRVSPQLVCGVAWSLAGLLPLLSWIR